MSLMYLQPVDDEQLLPSEKPLVLYLSTPPAVGDRVPLGGHRLWEVVAIDEYQTEGTDESLYLVHCHIGEVPPRKDWFLVQDCQLRPTSLQIYLGEGALLHWNHNLTGAEPKTGVLLPQYNVKQHTVTSKPWGVDRVTQYLPTQAICQPCYRAVWVGQCVYVPAALEISQDNLQIA